MSTDKKKTFQPGGLLVKENIEMQMTQDTSEGGNERPNKR